MIVSLEEMKQYLRVDLLCFSFLLLFVCCDPQKHNHVRIG